MFSHSNQNCSHHNRNRAFTRKTIATKTTTPVVRACSRLSCSDSLEFDIFAQKQHSQANRKFFQLHEYQKYLSLPSAIFFFYFFFSPFAFCLRIFSSWWFGVADLLFVSSMNAFALNFMYQFSRLEVIVFVDV